MPLSQNQLIHFQHEGYVIIENALTSNDLDPAIEGINRFIDEKARALKKRHQGRGRERDRCEPQEQQEPRGARA